MLLRAFPVALLAAAACTSASPLAAADPTQVIITRENQNALRVEIHSATPLSSIAFEGGAAILSSVSQLSAGEVRGEVIAFTAPTTSFNFEFAIQHQEQDAAYPPSFPIGVEGFAVYAPHFQPVAESAIVTLVPGHQQAHGGDLAGFLYVASAETVRERDGIVVVADPTSLSDVRNAAETVLGQANAFFNSALGVSLQEAPTLIFTHDEQMTMPLVGDVSAGSVIALRLHGQAWADEPVAASAAVTKIISHEAFHLWNGVLIHPKEGAPPWLHEGGAEYGRIVFQSSTQALEQVAVQAELNGYLEACRTGLGPKALSGFTDASRVRYACGVTEQWLADIDIRRATQGRRTVLSIWGELIETAKREGGAYDDQSFEEAARRQGGTSASLVDILDGGGDQWPRLIDAFQQRGVVIEAGASLRATRDSMLVSLLDANCSGVNGFYTEAGFVKLDTEDRCGVLSGNPEVQHVLGFDIFEAPEGAYEALRSHCSSHERFDLNTRDGRQVSLSCPALPTLNRSAMIVREMPSVAVLPAHD